MRTLIRTSGEDGTEVLHPTRHHIEVDHTEADRALAVADGYMDAVVDSIVNQPRSLQAHIGPSEMGVDCSITLLHKLNGDQEPERDKVPWKPTVGTGVHTYLEEAFDRVGRSGRDPLRWLTERKVTVGHIAGKPVTGSCDLFDLWNQAVIDHKCVGDRTGAKYRKSGPSAQYRAQAHLYGKGWEDAGMRPNLVMIVFLPRDGDLEDAFFWSEPYDRTKAEKTIARVHGLEVLRQTVGIEKALEAYAAEKCGHEFCDWHKSGRQNRGRNPRPAPATDVAGLFGL